MDRSHIDQMEVDAGTAGDLVQVALCQIATNGYISQATDEALTLDQRTRLANACMRDCDWQARIAQQILTDGERI